MATPTEVLSRGVSEEKNEDNNSDGESNTKLGSVHLMPSNNAIPFPWKLHRILGDAETQNFSDIISWVPTNNGFKVHKPKSFDTDIMPTYFNNTKYKSFQRQLNMWGFDRVGSGPFKGAYLHQYFVRGNPDLCERMHRTKIKGIHSKKLRKNRFQASHGSDVRSSHSSMMTMDSGMPCFPSPQDPHASFKAAAQKVADLERKKEEIQRKLEMVSNRANAAVASNALANMSGMIPRVSINSEMQIGQASTNNYRRNHDFFPLPGAGEGDSLMFGGQTFLFADNNQNQQQHHQSPRHRVARRYSLEPKGPESDEYVLTELEQGMHGNNTEEDFLMPTPLPPNMDVIKVTTKFPNSTPAPLVIGLDKPKRRFSFLSTPVENPLDRPYEIQPHQSLATNNSMMNRSIMNSFDNQNGMMMMNSNYENDFNRSTSNARDILLSTNPSNRISFN